MPEVLVAWIFLLFCKAKGWLYLLIGEVSVSSEAGPCCDAGGVGDVGDVGVGLCGGPERSTWTSVTLPMKYIFYIFLWPTCKYMLY